MNNDPELLKAVITSNETWVFGYDVGTKIQPKTARRPKKKKKVAEAAKHYVEVF